MKKTTKSKTKKAAAAKQTKWQPSEAIDDANNSELVGLAVAMLTDEVYDEDEEFKMHKATLVGSTSSLNHRTTWAAVLIDFSLAGQRQKTLMVVSDNQECECSFSNEKNTPDNAGHLAYLAKQFDVWQARQLFNYLGPDTTTGWLGHIKSLLQR